MVVERNFIRFNRAKRYLESKNLVLNVIEMDFERLLHLAISLNANLDTLRDLEIGILAHCLNMANKFPGVAFGD
jgi:hypothetical protein